MFASLQSVLHPIEIATVLSDVDDTRLQNFAKQESVKAHVMRKDAAIKKSATPVKVNPKLVRTIQAGKIVNKPIAKPTIRGGQKTKTGYVPYTGAVKPLPKVSSRLSQNFGGMIAVSPAGRLLVGLKWSCSVECDPQCLLYCPGACPPHTCSGEGERWPHPTCNG